MVRNASLQETLTGEGKVDAKPETMQAKTVNYTGLIPVLLEAVKEQQAIIEKLEKRIEALENK